MPQQPTAGPAPDRSVSGSTASEPAPTAPSPPAVLTALICEQCGNADLIRVKGCWYCEKCHYKFDCFGW